LLSGFGATVVVAEPRARGAEALRRFRLVLRAQLSLSVGLLPATGFFFGQVSLIAPLANLLVVPLFAVAIIPLLLIAVMALIVAPSLAGPVLRLADFILVQVVTLLESLNRREWIAIPIDMPGLPGIVAATGCVIAAALIWPRPLPARLPMVGLLLALALIAATHTPTPALRVVVMDVGQGLAVLLQTPGHAVLFDTGPRYRRGDAGRSIVLPVLHHFGVTRLDQLIVSHGDADHVGGARSVLAVYPEAEFLSPERLDVAARHFRPCRAGQHWLWDGVSFRVLHPGPEADSGPWSENDASCVLLVELPGAAILLPGDIERRAERWLAMSGVLSAVDLVIAPHHGSRTSSTAAFVAATRPRYVVFSAGYRNQWGFPAPDVRQRWSSDGACALTTGDLGALVFETSNGEPLRLVTRYRLDEARVWSELTSVERMEPGCRPLASTN